MKIIEILRGGEVPKGSVWLKEYNQRYMPSEGGYLNRTIDVWQIPTKGDDLDQLRELLKEAMIYAERLEGDDCDNACADWLAKAKELTNE